MANSWMIYGASGYTGTLIAEEAVRRGHEPILAGRSKEKLLPLAHRLGLEYLVLDLAKGQALSAAVKEVDLVLNAAGPFIKTSGPLAQACLEGSTHYADVTNEIPVFHLLEALHDEAKGKGVVLMPGVGFGVTVTNCLARYVAEQVPGAVSLHCAAAPYTDHRSPGFYKTVLDLLAQGGLLRREHRLTESHLGSGAIHVPFPEGVRILVPVPTGDLEAAYYATGIPNVTAYSTEFPAGRTFRAILPLMIALLRHKGFRNRIEGLLDGRNPEPIAKDRGEQAVSYGWAKAVDERGKEFQAWLEMGEGYQFTAVSSVLAAEKIMANKAAGFLTPSEAFGVDFVMEIPGVKRYTELPAKMSSKENP